MSALTAAKKRELAMALSPRAAQIISDALDSVQSADATGLAPTATHTTNQVAAFGQIVVMDATGGALTVTAPNPVGNAGKSWGMKLLHTASSHTITAVAHASETFDGNAAPSTSTPGALYTFVSDGANWIITHTGL